METRYTLNGTEITKEQAEAQLTSHPLSTEAEIIGNTVALKTLTIKKSRFDGARVGTYRSGSF